MNELTDMELFCTYEYALSKLNRHKENERDIARLLLAYEELCRRGYK